MGVQDPQCDRLSPPAPLERHAGGSPQTPSGLTFGLSAQLGVIVMEAINRHGEALPSCRCATGATSAQANDYQKLQPQRGPQLDAPRSATDPAHDPAWLEPRAKRRMIALGTPIREH
jgi:hypothetical protein